MITDDDDDLFKQPNISVILANTNKYLLCLLMLN